MVMTGGGWLGVCWVLTLCPKHAADTQIGHQSISPPICHINLLNFRQEYVQRKSSESSVSEICAQNGGCGSFLLVVVSGKCVHDKVAEAVLPPLSHDAPSPPPQFDTKPRWRGAAMDKLTVLSPFLSPFKAQLPLILRVFLVLFVCHTAKRDENGLPLTKSC